MARSSVRTLMGLVAALALVVAFTGIAQAATVIKATSSNTWNPKRTSVSEGTRVVWKNPTSRTHTVTAWKGDWSKSVTLSSGDSTAFRFNNTGTFRFRCTIHSTLSGGVCSGMCGVVKVA